MIRTQIYLPQSQIQLLKKTAYEEGSSISEVVRKYISQGTKTKKTNNAQRGSLGDRLLFFAKDAKRRGVKGPKDLASRVDYYLYGQAK